MIKLGQRAFGFSRTAGTAILCRIARQLPDHLELCEVESEAQLAARTISNRWGRPLDFHDAADQDAFCFAEEFPDYRDLDEVVGAGKRRTCNDLFDEFIKRCESRMAKNDLAFATLDSYRKILDSIWRPEIGMQGFESVKYSTMVKIADARSISKKTYNNIISPLRCAFDYGYRDHPEKHNPATGLKGFRITKKDRPVVDPFTVEEAEALIAAINRDWGEAQGNYDEFRFFTGLRPSEQIALRVTDCDLVQGKISVTKARVMARDKDRTKTSEDHLAELCPRALQVLKRHLALRAELKLQGRIDHGDLFFKEDGTPISNLQYPWVRWYGGSGRYSG
jgi:integrase